MEFFSSHAKITWFARHSFASKSFCFEVQDNCTISAYKEHQETTFQHDHHVQQLHYRSIVCKTWLLSYMSRAWGDFRIAA
jgi:hypothetical protein